jgi:hypothetical protein
MRSQVRLVQHHDTDILSIVEICEDKEGTITSHNLSLNHATFNELRNVLDCAAWAFQQRPIIAAGRRTYILDDLFRFGPNHYGLV